ncbi:39S ribosomal protein L52, mitochondrial-like [Pomacea canaliculata]|uniref:39S ribosomal protein L52, mitochondrial-like n=1 Tax=Pomacea canaliculata TaxID=400727 RepID=UPI000D72E82E|nr:39S ribosomal protein L52, mitochondrial-like [Pomacea canaliculata]
MLTFFVSFTMATSVCVRLLCTDKAALQLHRTFCLTSSVRSKLPKPHPLFKWGLAVFPTDRKQKIDPDLPDFTYCDGRPTPLTKEQLQRKKENYDNAQRVVRLVKEMEFAKADYARRQQMEASRREGILSSKLKQKSDEL